MRDTSLKSIEEVCHTLCRIPLIRIKLIDQLGDRAADVIRRLENGEPLPEKDQGAYDILVDALDNDAPEVETYSAEQDKGVYDVIIRGWEGAYLVEAVEYDTARYFADLNAAREYLYRNWGEFLVDSEE